MRECAVPAKDHAIRKSECHAPIAADFYRPDAFAFTLSWCNAKPGKSMCSADSA